MTSLYSELAKILREEKQLLYELYSTVSKERDAIISLNSNELEKITRDKELLLIKISLWDEEREKLLRHYGLEGKTITEIINMNNKGGEVDTAEIEELYRTLKALISAISEIQKINEQLIDHSMISIGAAIKFFESFGINPKQTLSREA